MLIQSKYKLLLIQCYYSPNTILIQSQYNINTMPIQSEYNVKTNSNAILFLQLLWTAKQCGTKASNNSRWKWKFVKKRIVIYSADVATIVISYNSSPRPLGVCHWNLHNLSLIVGKKIEMKIRGAVGAHAT